MIIEEIKAIKSGKRDLRKFGLTVGIVLAVIATYLLIRKKESFLYVYAAGGVFLLLGLALPVILKPVQKIWMTLALLMGWVMTRVILTFTFFVIFTPIGLISRLFGKDYLNVRWKKESKDSYWIEKGKPAGNASYENQF